MWQIQRSIRRSVSGERRDAIKRLRGRLTWFFYAGNRFSCPCCGGRFRAMCAFRPHGGRTYVGVRADARCPRCGSLERHRLLWLYYQRETNLFTAPLRVLNVAPEYLFQERLRRLPNLDYLSVDLDSTLAMERVDITRIPYPQASFDVILCNHVLEHIPDDRRAMRELHRVLRPGGWAVLQTPVDAERAETYEDPEITKPGDRARHFGQVDHVRIYGRDYADRLREAGFLVRVIDYAAQLGPEMVERNSLHYVDAIYLCTRSDAIAADTSSRGGAGLISADA